jgi:hypothetical protein
MEELEENPAEVNGFSDRQLSLTFIPPLTLRLEMMWTRCVYGLDIVADERFRRAPHDKTRPRPSRRRGASVGWGVR